MVSSLNKLKFIVGYTSPIIELKKTNLYDKSSNGLNSLPWLNSILNAFRCNLIIKYLVSYGYFSKPLLIRILYFTISIKGEKG